MATVAKLVETLSRATHVSSADIHHRARRLREANLLPGDGKGRGAPNVTARDCSVLLVGTMATNTASHVVEAVKHVNLLGPPVRTIFQNKRFELIPRSTFVDAVAHLIERLVAFGTRDKWMNALRAVGIIKTGDGHEIGWIETEPGSDRGFAARWDYVGADTIPVFRYVTVAPEGRIKQGPERIAHYLTTNTYVGTHVLLRLALILTEGR